MLSVFSSLEDGELIYKVMPETLDFAFMWCCQANESHSLYEVVRYGFSRTHGKQKDVCHRVAVFDFHDCPRSSSSDTLNEIERHHWTEASESCAELNVEVTEPLQVQNIVSQSDVLRYLERHKHLFDDILSTPVAELQLAEKSVVCVPADMTAVHAFASMFAFHVTSVGVVDNRNGGVLVANFSASDLRGMQTKDFPALSLPVLKFLQRRQALSSQTSVEGVAFLEDWGLCGGTINHLFDKVIVVYDRWWGALPSSRCHFSRVTVKSCNRAHCSEFSSSCLCHRPNGSPSRNHNNYGHSPTILVAFLRSISCCCLKGWLLIKLTAINLSAEFKQENFTHFVLLFNRRLAQEVCKAGFNSLVHTFEGCIFTRGCWSTTVADM